MSDVVRSGWDAFAGLPHAWVWLFGAWLLYALWMGAWILLQKREPVATLSWLMGLALLPFVGAIVYHVFGPQRIKRHRLRRSRTLVHLPHATTVLLDPDATELARLGQATTGQPPTSATSCQLLVDGGDTYEAQLAAIRDARDHVHVAYYIFQPDRSGTALRDALVERARAGIRVRLLLDAVGAGKCSRGFLAPLVEAGGEVAWFHPMRFGRVWRRPWLNMRNHRKIVIVDHVVGFTGGINITDAQDERLRNDAYRDLHLRLTGNIVRALQVVFVEDWAYATGSRDFIGDLARALPPQEPGPIAAQILTSGPDSEWEPIHRAMVAAIHDARARVWMATPYFVPGEAARMALTSAALGGLDVRLLVPRRADSRLVTHAARSYFDELIAAGVKVYEYGPRMLHSKALLVDDDLAIIGSANFDHRSFRLNFEVSVLFRDTGVTAALEKQIESEFAFAPRVRADRPQPLWRARLPEALARLLSPVL